MDEKILNYDDYSIIFYDGDCPFCNKMVNLVLKHEKDASILFSSLHSDFACRFLANKGIDIKQDTMYFSSHKSILSKSEAFFAISSFLKAPYSWLIIFKVIPGKIANSIYDIVAKNRKKLLASCPINSARATNRFIS